MDRELCKTICKILESGKSLSFEIPSPTQGGHDIRLSLNDKLIGEVYQYDKNLKQYENVLKGNNLDKDLGVNVQEWIHNDFFDYVSKKDELLGDSYNCYFEIDDDSLIVNISGLRNWGEGDEEIFGYMTIKLDIE